MELRFSVAFPFTSTASPATVVRSLKICTYYAELKHFFMTTLFRDNATIGRNDGDARKIYVDKRPAAPQKSVGQSALPSDSNAETVSIFPVCTLRTRWWFNLLLARNGNDFS